MKSALPEDVEDEALGVANQSVIEGIIAIKCRPSASSTMPLL